MTKPTPGFTLGQLREILNLPQEIVDDPDALTVREMADLLGVDKGTLAQRVEEAVRAGKLEEVRVRRSDSLGRVYVRTAYRIRNKEENNEESDSTGVCGLPDGGLSWTRPNRFSTDDCAWSSAA